MISLINKSCAHQINFSFHRSRDQPQKAKNKTDSHAYRIDEENWISFFR